MQQRRFKQSAKIDINADRYPEFWQSLSAFCRRLTGDRCCYPGCNCSKENGDQIETHHIIYGHKDEFGVWQPIKLYIPGLMLVPLCKHHHNDREHLDCAHSPKNYFKGTSANKYLDARNSKQYHLLLVSGWNEKLLPRYRSHQSNYFYGKRNDKIYCTRTTV